MIDVDESQIISLNILSLTGGLIPEFTIFDAQGSQLPIIQDTFDTQGSTRVAFPAAGRYRLEISNVSQSAGEYIVSTKMIRPYTPNSIFIPDNTRLADSFGDDDLFHRYWFSTDSENVSTVIVYGENFDPGIVATIRNLRSSEDVGVINTPAMASVYCIPAGVDNYAVDITHDNSYDLEAYNITITSQPTTFCDQQAILAVGNSLPTFTASELAGNVLDNVTNDVSENSVSNEIVTDVSDPVTDLIDDIVDVVPEAVCGATPHDASDNINMRALPSIAASVSAVVETSESLAVIGQTRNETWLHVGLLDGRRGYVSTSVLDLATACATIDLPYIWTDEAQLLRLELEAGILDLADIDADLLVGTDGIDLNVDGTVASIAGLDVDGTINADGITVNADGTVANTGIDANVTVDDGINADLQVNDNQIVDVEVDDGVGIDIDLSGDADADAENDGGIDIDLDLSGDDDDGIEIDINLGG